MCVHNGRYTCRNIFFSDCNYVLLLSPPDAQEEMMESGVIPEFAETVSEEGEDMVRRGERGRERMGKHSL